ncbi:hypothetical protein XHV734_5079 [Xanthomonas hortorum pv. vitians]|nr:hypothetical protein XHV734_5079 [Xanthomonas hortorum pv. vitians]
MGRITRQRARNKGRERSMVLRVFDAMAVLIAERLICGLAAGPLPAHHRRTRRKYVHVGSYATVGGQGPGEMVGVHGASNARGMFFG